MVLGPGTVSCIQRGDFSACMGETFFGNGTTQLAGTEPAQDVAAVAAQQEPVESEPVAAADPELVQEPIDDEDAGADETATDVSQAVLPSFAIVRVEPDGSAVIAGIASPDGEVRIFADDEQIGTETAEPSGDFAFVTEQPLPAGGVELRVLDVETDTYAGESVVVVVQDDRTSEPIVIASEPGEASQILQGLQRPQAVAEAEAPAAQDGEAAETGATASQVDEAEPMAAAEAEETEPVAPAEPGSAEPMAVAQTETSSQPAEATPATPQVSPRSNAPAPAEPAAETATAAPPRSAPDAATPQVEMPSPAGMADNQVAPAAPAPEAPIAPMAAPQTEAEDTAPADTGPQADPAPQPDTSAAEPEAEAAPLETTAPPEPAENEAGQSAPAENEAVVPEERVSELPSAEAEAPAVTAQPEPEAVQPTIDAVEIDGDRNFFAGAGTDGMTVRLYVDNEVVGTTEVADGRWLVEAIGVLDQENQRVRIDMLAEDGTVIGRAEVDFLLELPEVVEEEIAVAQEAIEPAQPTQPTPAAPAADEPVAQAPVETQRVDEQQAPAQAQAPVEPAQPADQDVPTLVGVTEGDRTTSGLAIIRSGDNLWTIARRVYGEGIRYTQIFEANTDQIRDPDLIYPGQVFDLPGTDQVVGEEGAEG